MQYSNLSTNVIPCLSLTEFNCIDQQENLYNAGKCQKEMCPLECETVRYDLSLSCLTNPDLKEFYSFSQTEILKHEQHLSRNFTLVHMTYSSQCGQVCGFTIQVMNKRK